MFKLFLNIIAKKKLIIVYSTNVLDYKFFLLSTYTKSWPSLTSTVSKTILANIGQSSDLYIFLFYVHPCLIGEAQVWI